MAAFAAGETSVSVATTVIEVGIDVPNATVMLVENAERFGLAQLHQLRGRVGRGPDVAHCILLASRLDLGDDARARLEMMARSHDGFRIWPTMSANDFQVALAQQLQRGAVIRRHLL